MEQLRRMDADVTKKAASTSIAVAVIGAFILGFGMILVMTDLNQLLSLYSDFGVVVGSIIGIVGIDFVCCAYPIYHHVIDKECKRIAPEVLRLTEELIK